MFRLGDDGISLAVDSATLEQVPGPSCFWDN